jgi:hypothetical protein
MPCGSNWSAPDRSILSRRGVFRMALCFDRSRLPENRFLHIKRLRTLDRTSAKSPSLLNLATCPKTQIPPRAHAIFSTSSSFCRKSVADHRHAFVNKQFQPAPGGEGLPCFFWKINIGLNRTANSPHSPMFIPTDFIFLRNSSRLMVSQAM